MYGEHKTTKNKKNVTLVKSGIASVSFQNNQ